MKRLDKRLLAGFASVQSTDELSPFMISLLDACAGYFDGRLRLRNWLYPIFKPKHPGLILSWETAKRPETFEFALDTARWLLTGTLINLYVHHRLMRLFKAPLIHLGVWDEFEARLDTHSTQKWTDLESLRGFLRFDPHIDQSLRAGELPDDEDFREEWDIYIERHGHRASSELDLAVPRLVETPDLAISLLLETPPARPPHTLISMLLFPLGWLALRRIKARDRFMFYAAFGFHNMRRHLLSLATTAVEQDEIAAPEAIWNMDIDSIRRLDRRS